MAKTFTHFLQQVTTGVKKAAVVPAIYASIGNRPDPTSVPSEVKREIPAIYASIGNRPDISQTPSIPSIFASIGNRPDPTAHKPAPDVNEWVDKGTPFSVFRKTGSSPIVRNAGWSDNGDDDETRTGIAHAKSFEAHYHPTGRELNSKSDNPSVAEYRGSSYEINHTLIHMHEKGLDPNNYDHVHQHIKSTTDGYGQSHEYLKYRTDTLHGHIQALSKVIHDSPETPHDVHLYTGVGWKFNVAKSREEGHGHVHLPAYTSTSLDPRVARSFAHVDESENTKKHREMIRIHLPKGSKHGTWLGQAGLGGEHEFLLHHGKTLKFKGEPKVFSSPDYTGKHQTYIIHDAEVHEEDK